MIWTKTAPLPPVTVAEVKAHLRIDDDFEDGLLSSYIISATAIAEQIMCREVIYRKDSRALAKSAQEVPQLVKQFVLCQVGDYYAHRELTDKTGYSTFFKHLLDPFILFKRDDEESA